MNIFHSFEIIFKKKKTASLTQNYSQFHCTSLHPHIHLLSICLYDDIFHTTSSLYRLASFFLAVILICIWFYVNLTCWTLKTKRFKKVSLTLNSTQHQPLVQ